MTHYCTYGHLATGEGLYKNSALLICVSVYVCGKVQVMKRAIVLPVSPEIQKPRDSLQCFLGTARSNDRNERDTTTKDATDNC